MTGHPFPHPDSLLSHAGFLRALARSLLLDEAQADDVVQQTLLAALEKPPAAEVPVRAWLARVARNLALMRRRTEGRIARRERAAARPEGEPPASDVAARLEMQRRVVEAVQALDEPYRSVVVHRYFDELRPEEIAAREGVPVATVKTRLRRALVRLRERFDAEVDGGRRAWSVALLPLALPPRAGAATAAVLTFGGILTMKHVATFGAVLVLALVLFLVRASQGREATPREESAHREPGAVPVTATDAGDTTSETERAAAGRAVAGVVRNEEGAPVPGAVVTVLRPVVGEGWVADGAPARSGEDGVFRADAEDPRPRLRVTHPDYVRAETYLLRGEIRLVRGTPVTVEVVRADGTPVAGARVTARSTGFALGWGPESILGATFRWYEVAHADTDAGGRARLGALPRETIDLIVDHAGFARWTERMEPAGVEPVTRRATLGPGGRIRGSVRSPAGDPVAGARVRCADERLRVAVTGDDGRYVLAHVAAGEWKVEAAAAGFAPASFGGALGWGEPVPVALRAGETRDGIDVVLAPATFVTGRVVDADGRGLAGVLVAAGWSRDVPGGRASVRTGPDGAFRVGPLALGKPGRIQVAFAHGAFGFPRKDPEAVPGRDLDLGDVRAEAPAVLRGRVAAPEGASDIAVVAAPDAINYRTWSVSVGADGTFRLEVPPGPAGLTAFADGLTSPRARVVGLPGDRNAEIELELRATRAIRGRVRSATGDPVPLQRVAAVGLDTGVRRFLTTDEDGAFVIGDLPEGSYRVGLMELWGNTFLEAPAPRVVAAGAEDVQFLLPVAGTAVRGRVLVKRDGQPVTSFRVGVIRYRLFVPVDANWHRVRSADGRFRIEVKEPGEYALEVEANGFAPLRTEKRTIAADTVVTFGELRLGDTGRVGGVVRDAAGRPVAFARIHVLSAKFESNFDPAFTDAEGRFEVADVPPGGYTLFAVSPRHPLGLVLGVQVAEAERTEVAVDLAAACPLVLRVLDAAGRPVPGARLVYGLPQVPFLDSNMVADYEPPGFGANEADAEGWIRKPCMPPGTIRLRIEVEGKEPVTRRVELEAGAPTELEIRLPG